MKGIYINLDRCLDRKHSLLDRLDSVGLSSTEYLRLSAVEPSDDEWQFAKGLKSKGELGIWRSLVSAFERIAEGGFNDLVHVIEDDADFSKDITEAIAAISNQEVQNPDFAKVDIVFLDYFLNRDLFAHVMSRRALLMPGSLELLAAEKAYLACCSSFLVRRSSAGHLASVLRRILETSRTLAPIDLTLRTLIRLGAIRAHMTVPLMGAVSWEEDQESSIQTHADTTTRMSQRAHILLRLLAAGMKTPFWCSERLAEMFEEQNPLSPSSGVDEFLAFFDSLQARMPSF